MLKQLQLPRYLHRDADSSSHHRDNRRKPRYYRAN